MRCKYLSDYLKGSQHNLTEDELALIIMNNWTSFRAIDNLTQRLKNVAVMTCPWAALELDVDPALVGDIFEKPKFTKEQIFKGSAA